VSEEPEIELDALDVDEEPIDGLGDPPDDQGDQQAGDGR